MNHDPRMLSRNILRQYRAASDEHVVAGLEWYDLAYSSCERAAFRGGQSVTHAVVALAHLSPRVGWKRNLEVLGDLLRGHSKPPGIFTRSWDTAARSLDSERPLDTFGRGALKTRNFAKAILGDRQAVVVDIWAGRVAGVEENSIKSQAGYTSVAEAYRRAGKREGISARDLQAITWCHVRGRAN